MEHSGIALLEVNAFHLFCVKSPSSCTVCETIPKKSPKKLHEDILPSSVCFVSVHMLSTHDTFCFPCLSMCYCFRDVRF